MFTCSKCPAKFKSFYNAQSHEKKCRGVSENPLDCICTYNSHRPAGQGTRTDVSRHLNCPVHAHMKAGK